MDISGALGNHQLARDLAVGEPASNKNGYFALARSKLRRRVCLVGVRLIGGQRPQWFQRERDGAFGRTWRDLVARRALRPRLAALATPAPAWRRSSIARPD